MIEFTDTERAWHSEMRGLARDENGHEVLVGLTTEETDFYVTYSRKWVPEIETAIEAIKPAFMSCDRNTKWHAYKSLAPKSISETRIPHVNNTFLATDKKPSRAFDPTYKPTTGSGTTLSAPLPSVVSCGMHWADSRARERRAKKACRGHRP